ncbi:MAG: Uma2 family endonuclease [Williamsia sp.]|nr:Uma2 family endonuclease [Williamsia sp.]
MYLTNKKGVLQALEYISPDDYLEQERNAINKHEYFKGEIVAMAGASVTHNRIVANIIRRVGNLLEGTNCEIFPSDLRVSIFSQESFTYPDATIICNGLDLSDDKPDTAKNPSVIFEVVSPSTEHNDRGRKFFFYMQIPAFREYILIDSTSYYIQVSRKQPDGSWKFEDLRDLQASLHINTTGHQISLQEIYANVRF